MIAHGLEKIKTIGDSYMAVAGVPQPHPEPVRAAGEAALEILQAAERISGPGGWKIRIGMHVGPLVAGVIGKHKFSYDVWGSTVNFASRMESSGAAAGSTFPPPFMRARRSIFAGRRAGRSWSRGWARRRCIFCWGNPETWRLRDGGSDRRCHFHFLPGRSTVWGLPNPRKSPAMPRPSAREKLLEAGLKCFHAQGYNGTSIEDIADAAATPPASSRAPSTIIFAARKRSSSP